MDKWQTSNLLKNIAKYYSAQNAQDRHANKFFKITVLNNNHYYTQKVWMDFITVYTAMRYTEFQIPHLASRSYAKYHLFKLQAYYFTTGTVYYYSSSEMKEYINSHFYPHHFETPRTVQFHLLYQPSTNKHLKNTQK